MGLRGCMREKENKERGFENIKFGRRWLLTKTNSCFNRKVVLTKQGTNPVVCSFRIRQEKAKIVQ